MIWLESFPELGRRRRVSSSGGTQPLWRGDGREILCLDPDNVIVAVPATPADPPLALGVAQRLFSVPLRRGGYPRQFDATADGQRLLINRWTEIPNQPIRLLVNWRSEVARRAGAEW